MAEEFEVRFGDDFTDRIQEIVTEAFGSVSLSDIVGWNADPSDYFTMDDYDQRDEVSDLTDEVRDLSAQVDDLHKATTALNGALTIMVTAFQQAGIYAHGANEERDALRAQVLILNNELDTLKAQAEQAQPTGGYYGVA